MAMQADGRAVLWKAIAALMAVLMAAMIGLVFANVVMRYGFASGVRPAIELSRLGFVWIVMLGAALALRANEHLAITEVVETLLPGAVPVLWVVTRAIIIGLLVMFVIGCWRQMMLNWADISQVTGLPRALFYVAGVTGGVLMILVAVLQILSPAPRGHGAERPVE